MRFLSFTQIFSFACCFHVAYTHWFRADSMASRFKFMGCAIENMQNIQFRQHPIWYDFGPSLPAKRSFCCNLFIIEISSFVAMQNVSRNRNCVWMFVCKSVIFDMDRFKHGTFTSNGENINWKTEHNFSVQRYTMNSSSHYKQNTYYS